MAKIKIILDDGKEIDAELSQESAKELEDKFGNKKITYDNIVKDIRSNISSFIDVFGNVVYKDSSISPNISNSNCNMKSNKSVEKVIAIIKLINVATYLNDGWKPDWDNLNSYKYSIYITTTTTNKVDILPFSHINISIIAFKTRKLAQQAIDILGEATIRMALETDLED